MSSRFRADDVVKFDDGIRQPLDAQMVRPEGYTNDFAAASPASAPRTTAKQQAVVHPLLHDLEWLIDRAWADYAAAPASAAAAQATSGVVAADIQPPGPRLTASTTNAPAWQEPGSAVRPTHPTSTVAPEIVRSGKSDSDARAMLRQLDAMLAPFKVADPAPAVQSPNSQKPPRSR